LAIVVASLRLAVFLRLLIIIDPEADDIHIWVGLFEKNDGSLELSFLDIVIDRVPGAIRVGTNGNSVAAVLFGRDVCAGDNRIESHQVCRFGKNTHRPRFSDAVNELGFEALLKKADHRQLDPPIHTVYRGTKAHNFILYTGNHFW